MRPSTASTRSTQEEGRLQAALVSATKLVVSVVTVMPVLVPVLVLGITATSRNACESFSETTTIIGTTYSKNLDPSLGHSYAPPRVHRTDNVLVLRVDQHVSIVRAHEHVEHSKTKK